MITRRALFLLPLALTALAPFVLYNDRVSSAPNPTQRQNFSGEFDNADIVNSLNESVGVGAVISDELGKVSTELPIRTVGEHKSRVLSEASAEDSAGLKDSGLIEQVTSQENHDDGLVMVPLDTQLNNSQFSSEVSNLETVSNQKSAKFVVEHTQAEDRSRDTENTILPDAKIRNIRDLLIKGKVYLDVGSVRTNSQHSRNLRQRIQEIQKLLGDSSKDSDLPKNAKDKVKALEQALAKVEQVQDESSIAIKKLRAMVHSAEEQLRVHQKQTVFLTQLAAKTLPKGLHCLPLRLATEYFSLDPSRQQFPNQEKLEDPKLYHYALFSDNILAAAVVVNSTVFNAKNPSDHVFHIVTDRLSYAPIRGWFLSNPPGNATIEVQNVEEFTWLNASYSPVLKQLGSQSMAGHYFKSQPVNSGRNAKYRNPKYLLILNYLRFYLPEIYPKLDKMVFFDDDIVVRGDLTALWSIDLKGKVNGAVETCGETFRRYLNFSNPAIASNFDRHACAWAFGMNVFDLAEWRRQDITKIYHSWQKLNHKGLLWKLGTLPPGLITFWNHTFPLDQSWHLLGLGYNPHVSTKEIQKATVIHYNGNMKPWLDSRLPKFRDYWSKYLDYDQVFLRECNINR